jgi:hypothetical protein
MTDRHQEEAGRRSKECGGDARSCTCEDFLPSVPEQQDGETGPNVQMLAWAVSNLHMLARRRINAASPDAEWWSKVLAVCEKAGARSHGVLRLGVPTEITEGSAAQSEDVRGLVEDLRIAADIYEDLHESYKYADTISLLRRAAEAIREHDATMRDMDGLVERQIRERFGYIFERITQLEAHAATLSAAVSAAEERNEQLVGVLERLRDSLP